MPEKTVHADGLPKPQLYWSVLAIWLALVMAVLDAAIANVALPTIAKDLHAPAADSIWVVNAYQLAIVISLLPFASLGEIWGYRRVFQAGLTVFTLASLGCTFAHTLPQLTLARVVQGFGAAGVMSVNGALLRYTYPQRMLGRGVGLNALVISVAAAVGPTVASGILSVGPWEWLFAINVPIGVIALVVAARALPNSDRSDRRFDWGSAALNAVFFGLLVSGVDTLTHSGSHALAGCGALVIAAIAGIWLVRRETRLERPLVPLDLLKIPVFALSVCASICAFSAQMLAFVSLPFFFEGALHRTQVQTGLLITPWPLAVGVAAPLAGRLADKVSAAVLGAIGMGLFAIGLAALAMLPKDAGSFDVVWRMALCGAGFGFFQSPNNRTMLSAAPRARAGGAGGMLATARLTGQTAGATLVALFFRAAPGNGETVSLGLAAVAAVAAGVLSVLRAGRGRPVAQADATAVRPAE